jgi:hypothetical protein
VASKSAYRDSEPGAEIEEMLDVLEKLIDRLKVMYEQYFLGIQKIAPAQLHTDAERKLRDLTQIQIRNTALRYRFATLQQKWGSYNNYWRRTVRQIEQGTYVRTLARVKRQAAAGGAEIPDEILAAMPKRMRDQVARDRALAQAQAKRRGQLPKEAAAAAAGTPLAPAAQEDDYADAQWSLPEGDDDVAEISHPVPRESRPMHRIDTQEMDKLDVQQMLDDLAAPDVSRPPRPPVKPPAGAGARPPAIPPARPTTSAMPKIPTPPARPGTAAGAPGAPSAQPPASPEAPRSRRVSANIVSRAGTVPGPPSPSAASTPPAAPPPTPAAAQPRPPAAPRAPTTPGPAPRPPARPEALPPGMTEADVRTLYQKYARARELVGERNDDTTYQALLRTLHQQAPKIMAQYKAKGVEFGVVIKDKTVVLKAKPKT